MKQQRRTAKEGKEHLLAVMREIHTLVTGQSEFTMASSHEPTALALWSYSTRASSISAK